MKRTACMVAIGASIAMVYVCCSMIRRTHENNMLSNRDEIIEIAKRVAIPEFLPLEGTNIYLDVDNSAWQKTLAGLSKSDPDFAGQYTRMLSNRDYQAVRFSPDVTLVIAGQFWVFVDRSTGEVIGYCGGL
jgi:predicted small secreted protein